MITVKELQNSVCHSGTQCCWQQFVQELIAKIPVLKRTFLLEKKFNFQNFENSDVFHITENLETGVAFQ